MSKTVHKLYIGTMTLIVVLTTVYLSYVGYDYYTTAIEERFYHPNHDWFKPSGLYGHGLGIAGTLMMMVGVGIYIARKRYNFLARFIRLKHLLEFHIFLCVLGPILIVFHTAFKIGGLVSVAFWCMVAVVLSGVIGRFIYIQIPRTIEGRELSINEIQLRRVTLSQSLSALHQLDKNLLDQISSFSQSLSEKNYSLNPLINSIRHYKMKSWIQKSLKSQNLGKESVNLILQNIDEEVALGSKVHRLQTMQKLFKYWHVAHLPFALIMLIIVVVHVVVTLAFGYKWIF